MDWADNPLVGTAFGFMLGILGTAGIELWRDWRVQRRVRMMLRLEIDQNFSDLVRFDQRLPQPGKAPTEPEAPEGRNRREWSFVEHRARAIVELPLPSLDRAVWTGQIALMPHVLTRSEIRAVSGFYAAMARLVVLRETLSAAHKEPSPGVVGGRMTSSPFEQRISQTRDEIQSVIRDAIEAGVVSLDLIADEDGRIWYIEVIGWFRARWRRLSK